MKEPWYDMKKLFFLASVAMTLVLASQVAHAQQKPAAGKGKNTSINFEDQLVEGQAQKPELFYMLKQKNANFKKLIRLREDFLPEMKKTSEDIQRTGSGN